MNLNSKSKEYRQRYLSFKRIMEGERAIESPEEIRAADQWMYGCYKQKPNPNRPPLSEMTLIDIDHIQFAEQYQGKYLKLKILMPCCRLPGILGLAEDHTGKNCIQFQVIRFDLKGKHYDYYFRPGSYIYIKHPLLDKLGSGPALHIDRKNDLLFDDHPEVLDLEIKTNRPERKLLKFKRSPNNPKETSFFQNISQQPLNKMEEEEYRLKGLKLVNNKEYVRAYQLYSEVLKKTNKSEYLVKFHINKGIVCSHFKLGKQYRENIDKALQIDPKNKKCLYHKAKYFILNNQFDKYLQFIKDSKNLLSQENLCQLSNFYKLTKSFYDNEINWYHSLSSEQMGEYQSKAIEFKNGNYGKGMFAKKDIKPGTILLIQKPFLLEEHTVVEATKSFTEVYLIPKLKEDLSQMYKQSQEFKEKIQNLPFGDSLKKGNKIEDQLKKIVDRNAFDLYELKDYVKKESIKSNYLFESPLRKNHQISTNKIGLFEKSCWINHRCEANCERVCIGSTMVFYAVEEIKEGTQIYINYTNNIKYYERKEILKAKNFQCRCLYCSQLQNQWFNKGYEPTSKSIKLYLIQLRSDKENTIKLAESYNFSYLKALLKQTPDLATKMLRDVFPMTVEESEKYLKEKKQ